MPIEPVLPAHKQRIVFLDIARGLAICLSFLIHTLHSLKIVNILSVSEKRFFTILTQTSTPIFVLLFGIMLELVYYRKLRLGDAFSNSLRRILRRSFWCYAGFVLTMLIDVVADKKGFWEGILSFFLMTDTPYSGILKFWTIALILSVPLLCLREKKGLTAVFILSLSLWLFVPLLDQIAWPNHSNPFSYWTGLFFGRPSNRALISLLHTLVFIVIGMILGEKLSSQNIEKHWTQFQKAVAAFICIDLVIAFCLMFFYSPGQLLAGYTTVFRKNHHLAYYCLSSLGAFLMLFVLSWIFPLSKSRISKIFTPLVILGQYSLPAFVFGNILIALWPKPENTGLIYGLICLMSVICILTGFLKMQEHYKLRAFFRKKRL